MDILPFDPGSASPAEWAAFHAFRRARADEDDPGAVLSDAEFEHDARRQGPFWDNCRVVAVASGEVVGVVGLGFRRQGTADYAEFARLLRVWGGVRRDWRRRGVGSALLRPVLAFMRERGKAVATLWAEQTEGHAFLTAIGAVQKQLEVENRLLLAGLDWDTLIGWEAAAPPGLQWEVHAGRVPLDRLAALIPSFTTLVGDAPTGDLETPPSRYDLQGYVTGYEEADRSGGEHLLVMLMHGEEVAGLCEGWWDARFPDRAYQVLTAVARPWRGQRLAKALKARMLRLVQERLPGVIMMATYNAQSNAPMLSINARLGFIRHKQVGTYQIGPDTLARWLATRTPPPSG